jgi:GTP-binding protein HflX
VTVSPSRSPIRPVRRAFLVGLSLPGQYAGEADEHLDELAALVDTAGAQAVGRAVQARSAPDPKTFLGRGKAEAIAAELPRLGADLVVVDDDLSGSQAKNLAEVVKAEVLDRSGLILRIFEQRAKSAEARTQVELARARYELPRLTRLWGHLSRQAGGIGVRGGEGESQLEADRRMLRRKIAQLSRDLARIEKMRRVQRAGRRGVPVVALAGYTNAGKSTLFNRLTRDGTLAEDRLFATLDSKLRRGRLLPNGPVVVFADTVGFIRKLPHHLVASFRSTLEEVVAADLVLHVVDRSHPGWEDQQRVAEEVMAELGVAPERILTVFNKIDRLAGPAALPPEAIAVSAVRGDGIEALRAAITRRLPVDFAPPPADQAEDDEAPASADEPEEAPSAR